MVLCSAPSPSLKFTRHAAHQYRLRLLRGLDSPEADGLPHQADLLISGGLVPVLLLQDRLPQADRFRSMAYGVSLLALVASSWWGTRCWEPDAGSAWAGSLSALRVGQAHSDSDRGPLFCQFGGRNLTWRIFSNLFCWSASYGSGAGPARPGNPLTYLPILVAASSWRHQHTQAAFCGLGNPPCSMRTTTSAQPTESPRWRMLMPPRKRPATRIGR